MIGFGCAVRFSFKNILLTRFLERQTLGAHTLSFIELFGSYGIKLDKEELESVRKILKKHNSLVR